MPITPQQFNTVTTGANQRLRADREASRQEYFRNGLLGDVGEVVIAEETFHPADILAKLAEETYRVARSESDQRYLEEAAERTVDSYPTPVALAYNAFLHGSTHPLTRLTHMRDTWEAIVSVCFSLVLTECASQNIKLSDVVIRDGPNNNPRPLAKRDLKSDSISVRLGCVEGILVFAKLMGLNIKAAQIIPVEVVGEMRRLNDIRNGFSHEQTKSDVQAAKIIEECEGDLLEVLSDLCGLAEVECYRVHGVSSVHANTLEVEILKGCSIARRISPLAVDAAEIALCTGISRPGDFDPVFVRCHSSMHIAAPYLYCQHDDTGHQTRVLMFKRVLAADAKARFEISGQSVAVEVDVSRVRPAIELVETLLDP